VSLSISKLGSGHSHSKGVGKNRDDGADFDMAASFLNFWYVFNPYLSQGETGSFPACLLPSLALPPVRSILF